MTLASALCVGLSAPAAAAPSGKSQRAQTITAKSCAATGGAFAQLSGARTCTTVRTETTETAPVTAQVTLIMSSWSGGTADHLLIGTSVHRNTSVTTTTSRQSPSSRVTVTRDVEQKQEVVPVSCVERVTTSRSGYTDRTTGSWIDGTRETTDTEMLLLRCEHSGLFVA